MLQTLRPLPLAPLRNALVSRMSQAMRSQPYASREDPDRVRLPAGTGKPLVLGTSRFPCSRV